MARDSQPAPRATRTFAAASAPPPSFISQQVTAAQRFHLSMERKIEGGFAVMCGGWEECATDYLVDRATFPYHSFEFVASGEGELRLGKTEHVLRSGTVFSYGPGVAQRIRTSPEKRLRKYFVDFAGPRLRPA